MHLTAPQDLSFGEDGYVVIPDLVSTEDVERLRTELDGAGGDVPAGVDVVWGGPASGGPRAVLQLTNAELVSPTLRRLIESPRLLELIAQRLGDDISLHTAKLFTKSGRPESAVPPHQDFAYWQHDTPEPAHVSCLVYLDDADEENGCLTVLPGSHRRGLASHRYAVRPGFRISIDDDEHETRAVPGRAGTAVLFGPLLAHGSAWNPTGRQRRACTIFFGVPGNGASRQLLREGADAAPVDDVFGTLDSTRSTTAEAAEGGCAVERALQQLWRGAVDAVEGGGPWYQVGAGSSGAFEWLASRKPAGVHLYRVDPLPGDSTPHPEVVVVPHLDALPRADQQERAALLHLQSRLYAPVRDTLAALGPCVGRGTVVVLDQCLGFPNWRRQAARALAEFTAGAGLTAEPLGATGRALAVRLVSGASPPDAAPPVHGTSAGTRAVRSVPGPVQRLARELASYRHFTPAAIPRFAGADPRSPCARHSAVRALLRYAASFVEDERLPWCAVGLHDPSTVDWYAWHKPADNLLAAVAGADRRDAASRDDIVLVAPGTEPISETNGIDLLGLLHLEDDGGPGLAATLGWTGAAVGAGTVVVIDRVPGDEDAGRRPSRAFFSWCRRRGWALEYLGRTRRQVALRVVATRGRFSARAHPFELRAANPGVRVLLEPGLGPRVLARLVPGRPHPRPALLVDEPGQHLVTVGGG